MPPLNILIVGCGIAGSTLATFLLLGNPSASEKARITILERAPNVRAEGQNIDIRGAGVTIIRKLGLETVIRRSTTGEEGVQFVDDENHVWAAFAADKSGKLATPTADIEILRGRLAEICWLRSKHVSEEVQREGGGGIEYIFGDYLDEIKQDRNLVHVRFAKSRQNRSYDVVIGADGLQSRTRNMVWGIDGEEDRVKRLGMYGAFFSIPKGKTDTNWRRWYHAPGRRSIMLRPGERKDRATIFMTVINERDSRLIQVATKGPDAVDSQKNLMAEYFQNLGWECPRIVEEMRLSKDFYYDLVGQVKMDKWSKGRVVLLGDAGYCASPISGMGTTLALSGAYNLAGAIVKYPNDLERAFSEYHDDMRPVVERAQKLGPGFPHILNPETTWGVWMLNMIVYILCHSGVMSLLFRFVGPPANTVPVKEFGFRQLPEWDGNDG